MDSWSNATGIKWLDDAAANIKATTKAGVASVKATEGKLTESDTTPVVDANAPESQTTVAGFHPVTLVIVTLTALFVIGGGLLIYEKIHKHGK